METKQPNWELIANLGDVHPADYGGFLVYRDTTGVYGPEVEVYEPNQEEETGGTLYRFMLETGDDEWFMDKLPEVAGSCGQDVEEYRNDLKSGDPVKIALVYRGLTSYFGCFEFDQYPLTLAEKDAQERYANVKK